MADNLDNDIYSLIGYYGFKKVHSRLLEIMKDEYTYLHSHFQVNLVVPVTVAVESIPQVLPEASVKQRKPRKVRAKKVNFTTPLVAEVPLLVQEDINPEIKEVILVPPNFRDPKEVKEYQKKAEETKRKENDALGIQVHTILTKENLKQWIEEEGRTYAWVAREKAGCADTQVAATAQMMGIKSKISRKRGMIMSGN